MDYLQTRELYHHGIKGQKWGVRRYQYKDGTWTEEGKRRRRVGDGRVGSGESPVSRKTAGNGAQTLSGATSGSKRKPMDPEKRKKILKGVAITAGLLAATGFAAYGVHKYKQDFKDIVIKGSDTIQRLDLNEELYDNFYGAIGKHDKARYDNLLPGHLYGNAQALGKDSYNKMLLQPVSDLKIASSHNAEKVYKDLLKNDAEFAKLFKDTNYDEFNQYIVTYRLDDNKAKAFQKFKDTLAKKGYAGVVDVNDQKYSGYGAQNPVIVFNKAAVALKSIEKKPLNDAALETLVKQVEKEAVAGALDTMRPQMIKTGAKAAALTAGVAGYKYGAQVYEENQQKKKKDAG